MVVEYFTKSLQITFLHIFQIIIRSKHISNMGQSIDASTKERVGSTGGSEIDKEAKKSVS